MNFTMEDSEIIKIAVKRYREVFNSEPTACSVAPGRVNLIGEHTDYNDGFVLPMALPLVTVIVGALNNTKSCHIVTICKYVDNPRVIEFSLDNPIIPGKPTWANYIKGVIANFPGKISGFNAVVTTSIPIGGGLSSSAALEVATYRFLEEIHPEFFSDNWINKAKLCQKAEHEFCEMPCGIMDQFVSIMGKDDHALLIDCRSLKSTLVYIKDPNISVLITNTNVRHKLSGSEYPTRRKQCEKAADIIGKPSLRDASMDDLYEHESKVDSVVFRRAKHVITEIQRTTQSAVALQNQDYAEFGKLMNASHQSLKDDYEVSCAELNQVVQIAQRCSGVYGSRMTGGGFGGCSVTLLDTIVVPDVVKAIECGYSGNPSFFVCRPASGARVVKLVDVICK